MHDRRRILFPIILILAMGALVFWYFTRENPANASGALQASGSVEAVEVQVAPEIGGRVAQVMAQKGDEVQAGEALLRLDDELLQAQRQRAAAASETAKANLKSVEVGVEGAQAAVSLSEASLETANASAEAERVAVQQAIDDLYENVDVARAEASRAVAAANRLLREALYDLDNFTVPSNQANLTAMEGVEVMEKRLERARQAFEPYKYRESDDPTREDMKEALDDAQSDFDSAVKRLEYETEVAKARARLDKAMRDLDALADGPSPDNLAALQARLVAIQAAPKQAQAAVDQAKEGLLQAQARVEPAQEAVAQAQAELDYIDTQLKKLVVYAAADGVVTSRKVEPGEVIQAGAPVMTIGKLGDLTITVYIPEDRFGQIQLGQEATVTVDSFPGETFKATVVYIADQAEFTPRNVQTAEGRKTTVFAVDLAIEPEAAASGKLKPGMPADVRFNH